MKHVTALIAAAVITTLVGAAMFAVGANAMLNKNTVPIANSPTAAANNSTSAGDPPGSQIQQLQNLIAQYQQREQQYQDQINQLEQQLNQDSQNIQQYQNLLMALQERGVILITRDGRVLIPDQ